jgi:RNA-binding protein YhbY
VKWANHVFAYQAKNDYSQISQVYSLDEQTYATLAGQVDKKTLFKLKLLEPQTYTDRKSFIESMTAALGHRIFQKMGSTICQLANLGQRKFQKHLGWLEEYRQELITYTQMVDLSLHIEAQIKNFGLNKESKALFEEKYLLVELTSRSQHFKEQVIDYLAQESAKVPEDHTLLSTSEGKESLFGKYKQFTSTNCLKELGKRILTIPLCTLSITGEFVKNAIENISEIDVENWANSVFGQSVLSKRREAFPSVKKTQK